MKKIKCTIYLWAGQGLNRLEDLGYTHNQEIEIAQTEVGEIANKIWCTGLNVMLLHSEDERVLICVDTKRFQQR